ncbi:MAG: aminopeptidase, partial [Clostridia bacterium]|nr:aminopeptidase [Clostridia bacterium]
TSIAMAEEQGYVPYTFGMDMQVGGKYYYNNRGRSLFLFRIGSAPVQEGIRICAAHIDSPRLDLKQSPLYEDGGFGFFKTRYYGGIRKYQWVATPLALHGVVIKQDGTTVQITIGEDDADPVLYINDLLPHLGQNQNSQPLGTAIPAENLNILLGSRPLEGEESDKIKMNILKLLNEKYGIVEADFLSADLSLVPAAKARDVGLDRSLIGSYGHDDRVCAYPALTALFENPDAARSTMVILADKEEIGSDGDTGMQCELLLDLLYEIAKAFGANFGQMKANSICMSADVTACYDPNFAEVFDSKNVSRINCGICMCKYTGHGGKVATNDASAELVAFIRRIMAKNEVIWQAGDMGKNDLGGGGTVAKYISKHNIPTVDMGVPVIAMHSPFEIVSKADVYTAHKAFAAFYTLD